MASNIANIATGNKSIILNYSSDNTTTLHVAGAYSDTSTEYAKNHVINAGTELSRSSGTSRIQVLKNTTLYFWSYLHGYGANGAVTFYIYVNGVSKYSSTTGSTISSTTGQVILNTLSVQAGDYIDIYRKNGNGNWETILILFMAT